MGTSISEQISGLDAVALAELVRHGEITAGELLAATLARVDQLHPQLNAVVERFDELAESHAADCNTNGSLAGVPIFLKVLMSACTGAPLSIASDALRGSYDCRTRTSCPTAVEPTAFRIDWQAGKPVSP